MSLLSSDRPAFALSLESGICDHNFSFIWEFALLFDAQLQKSAVIESQSQQGPWESSRLHVHATHKQGQDGHIWPLQLIYTAGKLGSRNISETTCCAKHPREPWPEGDVKVCKHGAGFYTPRLLMVDQVTLCVMIWGEPALVPLESPHLLALCLNFQLSESLFGLRQWFP